MAITIRCLLDNLTETALDISWLIDPKRPRAEDPALLRRVGVARKGCNLVWKTAGSGDYVLDDQICLRYLKFTIKRLIKIVYLVGLDVPCQ